VGKFEEKWGKKTYAIFKNKINKKATQPKKGGLTFIYL
jgi:hypothetical protein